MLRADSVAFLGSDIHRGNDCENFRCIHFATGYRVNIDGLDLVVTRASANAQRPGQGRGRLAQSIG